MPDSYIVSAAGADHLSVSRTSSRYRADMSAAYPGLLAQCRPTLSGWDMVRQDRVSEVSRLILELRKATREKAQIGEQLEDVQALLVRLSDEERRMLEPVRATAIIGEISVAIRLEKQHQERYRAAAEHVHTLGVRADAGVQRHNSIITALESGRVLVPVQRAEASNTTIGGTAAPLTIEQAEQLAQESIRLVGRRLESDDRPPPTRPIVRVDPTPPSWSRPSFAAHALLLAEQAGPPARMVVHEDDD